MHDLLACRGNVANVLFLWSLFEYVVVGNTAQINIIGEILVLVQYIIQPSLRHCASHAGKILCNGKH